MNTIDIGQRVNLLSMNGTCVGFKIVSVTAKNYCDGSSTIQLRSFELPLIEWDEAPGRPVPCDDIGALTFI